MTATHGELAETSESRTEVRKPGRASVFMRLLAFLAGMALLTVTNILVSLSGYAAGFKAPIDIGSPLPHRLSVKIRPSIIRC